ncbi:hypothetical protein ABK040_006988 [Willaertia magna]
MQNHKTEDQPPIGNEEKEIDEQLVETVEKQLTINNNEINNANDTKDEIIEYKFIADGSLCKIAKHIRLLGYDCLCDFSYSSAYIIYKATIEKRIVLTGGKQLLQLLLSKQRKKNKELENDYYDSEEEEENLQEEEEVLNNKKNEMMKKEEENNFLYIDSHRPYSEQLNLLIKTYPLIFKEERIFTRCLKCNIPVTKINTDFLEKEEIDKLINLMKSIEKYNQYKHTVTKCLECKKYYWVGHYYFRCVEFAKTYSKK